MIIKSAELYKNYLYKYLKEGNTITGEQILTLKDRCNEELRYIAENLEKYNGRGLKILDRENPNP